LTSTPLLDAEVLPVLCRLRFWDLNIELPTILKWLDVVILLMDFFNICGDEGVES